MLSATCRACGPQCRSGVIAIADGVATCCKLRKQSNIGARKKTLAAADFMTRRGTLTGKKTSPHAAFSFLVARRARPVARDPPPPPQWRSALATRRTATLQYRHHAAQQVATYGQENRRHSTRRALWFLTAHAGRPAMPLDLNALPHCDSISRSAGRAKLRWLTCGSISCVGADLHLFSSRHHMVLYSLIAIFCLRATAARRATQQLTYIDVILTSSCQTTTITRARCQPAVRQAGRRVPWLAARRRNLPSAAYSSARRNAT